MKKASLRPTAIRRAERRSELRLERAEQLAAAEAERLRRQQEFEVSQERARVDRFVQSVGTKSPDGLPAVWKPRADVRVQRARLSPTDLDAKVIRYNVTIRSREHVFYVPLIELMNNQARSAVMARIASAS